MKRDSTIDFNDVAETFYVSEISEHESSDYDILDKFSPNQEYVYE